MIMEAENPMIVSTLETQKGNDIIQFKSSAREDELRYPSSSSEAGKKGENSSFLCLLFYSDPQRMPTHPHWGRQPTLPSPQIQMLISFRSTLTDTLRNDV